MSILKKYFLLISILILSINFLITPADASVQLDGQFKATKTCQALQSIRMGTNPGNVRLEKNQVYEVISKDRNNESHYLIRMNNVRPPVRWVAKNCGKFTNIPISTNINDHANANPDYLLAINWQPSFCETKPNLKECKNQTEASFEARNLVLHGLWPQPEDNQYCNVSEDIQNKKWSELPPIDLSRQTRKALQKKMPGYLSNLHLHEWYKHGTCYSDSPEEYYRESLALLKQINNSGVRDLFVRNIDSF